MIWHDYVSPLLVFCESIVWITIDYTVNTPSVNKRRFVLLPEVCQ